MRVITNNPAACDCHRLLKKQGPRRKPASAPTTGKIVRCAVHCAFSPSEAFSIENMSWMYCKQQVTEAVVVVKPQIITSNESMNKAMPRPKSIAPVLASKDSLGLREPPRRFISFKPRGAMAFPTIATTQPTP